MNKQNKIKSNWVNYRKRIDKTDKRIYGLDWLYTISSIDIITQIGGEVE